MGFTASASHAAKKGTCSQIKAIDTPDTTERKNGFRQIGKATCQNKISSLPAYFILLSFSQITRIESRLSQSHAQETHYIYSPPIYSHSFVAAFGYTGLISIWLLASLFESLSPHLALYCRFVCLSVGLSVCLPSYRPHFDMSLFFSVSVYLKLCFNQSLHASFIQPSFCASYAFILIDF